MKADKHASNNDETEVPREIEGVLERVEKSDPESASVIREYLEIQQISHRGPMPSPEDLARYSQVQADLPERMMKMAENALEIKARQHDKILELKEKEIALREKEIEIDDIAHKRDITSHYVTIGLAFIVVLICLLGSFFLAMHDKTALSLLVGGTTVVGIVGAFLRRPKDQND